MNSHYESLIKEITACRCYLEHDEAVIRFAFLKGLQKYISSLMDTENVAVETMKTSLPSLDSAIEILKVCSRIESLLDRPATTTQPTPEAIP